MSEQARTMGPPPGSSGVNTMYRSVPPRPFSYTFSDVLHTSLHQTRTPGLRSPSRSKTAPVFSNTPEEYAERFKSRPTTRPSVIDLDGAGVRMYAGSGAVCRFNQPSFPAVRTSRSSGHAPPVKLNRAATTALSETLPPQPLTERGTASTTSGLHLAPLGRPPMQDHDPFSHQSFRKSLAPRTHTPELPDRPYPGLKSSTTSSVLSHGKSTAGSLYHHPAGADFQGKGTKPATAPEPSDSHWQELSSSKLSTLDALTFSVPSQGLGEHAGYAQGLAHSEDFDDLSELPKPKRILPRRDLPWVFRFKVKKELNALSKIMASKPSSSKPVTAVGPSS